MRKLSNEEIGNIGLYEFQGYIGAMTSPTFGGWKGTDRLIELLDIKGMERPRILEVGCSTGYITRYVAQKFDCEIVGADISEILIELAREESEKLDLKNVSFERASAESLPFVDNSFDIVYGEAITALVSDPVMALKEYRRVLKKGGKVATLDLFMKGTLDPEFYQEMKNLMVMSNIIGPETDIKTLKEWENIFKEAGFNHIKINDYYEDIFVRDYSFAEKIMISIRVLYHMAINRDLRRKLGPMLKFVKKFPKALEGDSFGYFIFTGVK
ncbi:MAG TPA: methyltransferase domain-containing protein [Methanofastidiosum sp.]|jgi:ubiquinone/menaquinone biosynthesis C-methylase UbiE|nr:methyltransferase domain-containing protein [Methanofastidiosum sp.]